MSTVNVSDLTHCVYNPKTNNIVSMVVPCETGDYAAYSGKLISEILAEDSDNVVMDFEEAWKMKTESCKSEPVEITKDQWREMLEILPPVAWTNRRGAETFKMSERYFGDVTTIYCRIGEKYYSFSDSISMKHEKIVETVLDKFPSKS